MSIEQLGKMKNLLQMPMDLARLGRDACGPRSELRRRGQGLVTAVLVGALGVGCSSKSPCADPKGSNCPRTNAYATDDPHSVCHVCCESNSSYSDAWTELDQTDIASGRFNAIASQGRPYLVTTTFSAVQAIRWTSFFIFDDTTSNPNFGYHLLTRGRSDEGNLQVYVQVPGDPPISVAPLNCNIAQN